MTTVAQYLFSYVVYTCVVVEAHHTALTKWIFKGSESAKR